MMNDVESVQFSWWWWWCPLLTSWHRLDLFVLAEQEGEDDKMWPDWSLLCFLVTHPLQSLPSPPLTPPWQLCNQPLLRNWDPVINDKLLSELLQSLWGSRPGLGEVIVWNYPPRGEFNILGDIWLTGHFIWGKNTTLTFSEEQFLPVPHNSSILNLYIEIAERWQDRPTWLPSLIFTWFCIVQTQAGQGTG